MKKSFFGAFLLLFCAAIGMQATDRKVTRIVSTSASGEASDYYLYNAEGQLMWVQSSNTSTRDVYQYNTKGQLVRKTTMSWIPDAKQFKELNRETYTYGEDGLMTGKDQLTSIGSAYERHYVYSDYKYEDGKAMSWHMEDVRANTTYKYDYRVILTRDAEGRIQTENTEEMDYDYPEDGFCAYEGSTFTYKDNGDINTEVRNKYNYSYDKVRKTETLAYTFSDLDAKYAPTGLKATPESNTISLSWDAVEGASSYIVTYDLEHQVVEGTSFTAKDIAIGDHEFTVQAVVDGEEKNAATPVAAALVDAGRLPAENFVAGTPRISVEYTDEGDARTFYVIPFTWNIPADHSPILNFRLHYTSVIFGKVFTSVESTTATSFELKLDEYDVRRTDEEGHYTGGADMEFYVGIVYGSGESEASNIVKINPYNLANGLDTPDSMQAIEAPTTSTESTYNLNGQRVKAPSKGIFIRGGKKIAVAK